MSMEHPRMKRERRTLEIMIRIYCRRHHDSRRGLCQECEGLLEYSNTRLDKCPYQENKTTCAKCPVHCYKPEMRERIRAAMRYSGPRMLFRHPVLALVHLKDGRRKEPKK